MSAHREVVDGHGCDGGRVPPQLPGEDEAAQVPKDAGVVPGAAHDQVVGPGGSQASHRLRVAVQVLLQAHFLLVELPHRHDLSPGIANPLGTGDLSY